MMTCASILRCDSGPTRRAGRSWQCVPLQVQVGEGQGVGGSLWLVAAIVASSVGPLRPVPYVSSLQAITVMLPGFSLRVMAVD